MPILKAKKVTIQKVWFEFQVKGNLPKNTETVLIHPKLAKYIESLEKQVQNKPAI